MRHRWPLAALAGLLCLGLGRGAVAAAPKVLVGAGVRDGYDVIVFTWEKPPICHAGMSGKLLTVTFDQPLQGGLDVLPHSLPTLIESARLANDHRSIVIKAKEFVTIRVNRYGTSCAIDLLPLAAAKQAVADKHSDGKHAAAQPEATREPAEAVVYVKAVTRDNGENRLVFASREGFDASLSQTGQEVTLAVTRRLVVKTLSAIGRLHPTALERAIRFALPEGDGIERTNEGRRVFFDIVVPAHRPAAAAAADPPQPAPKPAAPTADPVVATAAAAAPVIAVKAVPPGNPLPPLAEDGARGNNDCSATVLPAPPAGAGTKLPGAPAEDCAAARALGSLPQSVTLTSLPDGVSLSFTPAPAASAVFRRGDYVWVAFAGQGKLDLAALRGRGAPFVRNVEPVPAQGATVLRLRVADRLQPSLRDANGAWIVDLRPLPAAPVTALQSQTLDFPPRLSIAVARPSPPVTVTDPAIGDQIAIVPVPEPGAGIATGRNLVDLTVLQTVQGLAFAPRSDGVEVASRSDAVEVTGRNGLLLSIGGTAARGATPNGRIFDFAAWAGSGDVLARRRALEAAVVAAKPAERTSSRIDLARFYVAIGYGAEARGVLAAIARDDPAAMQDPALRALRGVALLLDGRTDEAAADLATPLVANDPDCELWRGAWLARRGDNKAAASAFQQGQAILPTYPKALRIPLALAAAGARLAAGLDDGGMIAEVLHGQPSEAQRLQAEFLQGRLLAQRGNIAGAIETWDHVAAGDDRMSAARARYEKTQALLKSGRIDRPAALAQLDALRFAWRGGRFEFDLLRRIGELKLAEGDYSGGLASLREALVVRPHDPQAAGAEQELKDAFARVFVGNAAAQIPAMTAVAVYEGNKDLMPAGPAGDAITRSLADRLAAVDLLAPAAALLENQAKTRLSGVEQARVMTRVALLRLLDRKPQAALDALGVGLDQGLPPELAARRLELRARALLDLQKPVQALATLNGDGAPAADKLRAEIAIKTQNWAAAAAAFGRLAGAPPASGALGEAAAQAVLNCATALTLAHDHDGLAALRQKFQAAMNQTRFRDGFRVLAGTDTDGSVDPRELTSRLAQISDLEGLMASYRQQVAQNGLSAVN